MSCSAIRPRICSSLGATPRIGQLADQRVALEVHLRDQPLHPALARDRVVDVRRAPVVDAVAPRVGAGLDGAKRVVAVVVGQHPAAAAEVRVERADVLVLLVPVAAAGVALPDLDQRVRDRPAELVLDIAVDDDALADRHAALGVVEDQVVVLRPELVGAKHRRGHLGERLLQRDQRQPRAAQDAGLVGRRVRRRVRRRVAHQVFAVGGGGRSHVDVSWVRCERRYGVRGKQVSKDRQDALAILCSGHGWPCKGRECPDQRARWRHASARPGAAHERRG